MGPSAGTLGFPPPLTYGFAAEPKTGETGEERPGEERKEREGSAAQFVASKGLGFCVLIFFFCFFVFFHPFPFSYVKSAGKPGSSLKVSNVSRGEGQGGAQACQPSLGLKVVTYCLETCFSLNTRQ